MQVIDELMIALGLKSDGVKKGMKEAESAISSGLSSIKTKLGAIGAAFTAALSLGAAFQQYTQEADAMGKLADALDVDISKMHAWGEAAARAGGSAAAFQGSLQSLAGQLSRTALTGSSRAKTVLDGAGIDAGELGRQREAFDVMMDLAAKAEEMGKAEFFGLGRSLGLDTGTIMLLQQGRQALKDQIQAQKEFGVYTKEDAKVTADFNDRMADFGQAFKSLASIIFRMVLPPFNAFMKMFNQAIAYLRKHEKFIQAFFIGIATIITAMLIPAFVSLAAAILANPLTWAVAAFAALALVIEDLVVWAEGGESALSDLWEAIFGSPEEAQKTWAEIKQGFSELLEFIKPILAWIKENLIAAFKAVYPYVVEFAKSTKELMLGLKDVFSSLARHIMDTLGAAFNWVVNKWNSVASVLGMTKINVQANVVTNESDATHGGSGNTWGDFVTSGPQRPEAAEAEGGILTYPTHALVAEAGPEAIIPLSNQRRGRALDILGAIAPMFAPKEQEYSQPGRSLDDIASLFVNNQQPQDNNGLDLASVLPTNTERIETERFVSEKIAPVVVNQDTGIVDKLIAAISGKDETVKIDAPKIDVNVPKQDAPNVNVSIPKADAPQIDVDVPDSTINVPKQDAPQIDVGAPQIDVGAPNIEIPQIEVPEQDGLLRQVAALFSEPKETPPTVEVNAPQQEQPETNDGLLKQIAAAITGQKQTVEVNVPQQDAQEVVLPAQEQTQPNDGILSRVASMLGDFAGMAARAFEDIGGQNIPVMVDASKMVVAAEALPAGGNVSNVSNSSSSETKIGAVNVYTQADDAKGIAGSIPRALEQSMAGFNAMQADFAY